MGWPIPKNGPRRIELAIDYTDLAGQGGAAFFAVSATLPAGARHRGATLGEDSTAFDDPGHNDWAAEISGGPFDQVVSAAVGPVLDPVNGDGVFPREYPIGGVTVTLTLTVSGTTVSAATQGHIKGIIFYDL